MSTPSIPERPKKLQRISQACDLCHRRSIRCRPSAENAQHQCQNCFDFAVECTYNRPSRRRRNQSVSKPSPPNILPNQLHQQQSTPSHSNSKSPPDGVVGSSNSNTTEHSHATVNSHATDDTAHLRNYGDGPDYTGALGTVREGRNADGVNIAWRSFALASQETIEQLLSMYMDVVYPIFPLFHEPTLWERFHKKEHLTNREFFASVMGACALASARARDGALNEYSKFNKDGPEQQSEIFFSAASDAISKDLNKAQGFEYLRACGLLAMTSIQYGQIASMHQYHGHFCTLSSMQHFHDESHWPHNISLIEREERRRLYWSMYSMDILSASVFNSVLKFQETSANVSYPAEVDDENLSAHAASPSPGLSWIRGWNFTNDLYRVLEHTIKRVRRDSAQHRDDRISVTRLLISDGFTNAQIMDNVLGLYYQLPARFKDYTVPISGNRQQDLYGFQAANIQATLQLVRMTLFSSNVSNNVYEKCNVAEQVLSTFHAICPRFLQAISTPLVYHIGGIGQLLASVMEDFLTEASYKRVRGLLASMADLLEGLESGLQPTAGASKGLRMQIDKIDQYMEAQRRLLPCMNDQMPSMSGPQNLGPYQTQDQSTAFQILPSMDEFQLPQELIGNWPWPFDVTQPGYLQPIGNFNEFNAF